MVSFEGGFHDKKKKKTTLSVYVAILFSLCDLKNLGNEPIYTGKLENNDFLWKSNTEYLRILAN